MAAVKIEIFDPPMCCATGICGPTVDPNLIRVNEAILALEKAHPLQVEIKRYMPTTHPAAFLGNQEVVRLMREQGVGVLPITAVNGTVVRTGGYLTYEEMEAEVTARQR
ncbi:MAG: arsenite efflux transporter metallochaperone ArsD [Chitinophagales bacterium]